VNVPVTADVENGYGLPPEQLVSALADCGVAGCNLEDSDPASRALADPSRQAAFLAAVRSAAGQDLVINARVDVYVRPHTGPGDITDAAVARAGAYLAAGADCVYPIIAPPAAIPELVRRIDGPVNAMCLPGGPTLAELAAMGVARITFGGGLHAQAGHLVQELAGTLAAQAASIGPAAS
jgi:2-methylisocitrate lyase-like PEP mutase family enzyme